ncbi:GntR family transcriptional regulator [Baekduia alba]|uniref:GntR family transcriptional regulator n=1 Tax=Baekduia alba TaxID=2997333 RepID=UPI0023420FC9|nr:GntR family transcriptional regulator [Baekduia alba]
MIRDAIRQRLLTPGAPLVQSAIAEAFGVSRIPVREALQYLASEGLVTFGDDGARVTLLSTAEIYELWTLRAVIEASMAEATAKNIGPSELDELRGLVDAMDHAKDGDEWSDLNYQFHMAMYRMARLAQFASVARRVLTLIEPYSRVAVKRLQGKDAAQSEHREMIAALENRDAQTLRDVLERSSIRVRALMVDWAEGRSATPPPAATPASQAARAFVNRLFPDGVS